MSHGQRGRNIGTFQEAIEREPDPCLRAGSPNFDDGREDIQPAFMQSYHRRHLCSAQPSTRP